MKKMCSLTAEERCRLPKVSPSRADIVIGGGVVLDELMEAFGVERLRVCRTGLREGMKIDYLQKHGHSDFDVRSSSIRSLAARCGCNGRHEDAVSRYAAALYTQFTEIGLIPESEKMLELLKGAARLHDIGTFISYEKHHVHSYNILKDSYLAGFDSDELDLMALMVRYHHGSFPGKGHKLLAGLPVQKVALILRYSMILRMADILDRGRDDAITEVTAEKLNESINITLVSKADASMAQWKLAALSEDFRSVFSCTLNICVLRL